MDTQICFYFAVFSSSSVSLYYEETDAYFYVKKNSLVFTVGIVKHYVGTVLLLLVCGV